jgi:hypothetical protein
VTAWHWWCGTHGQIDAHVRVRQSKRGTGGWCRLCSARAVWRPQHGNPDDAMGEQLDLFGSGKQG